MNASNNAADNGSIRELTADELDAVGGGIAPLAAIGLALAGAVAGAVGAALCEVASAAGHWAARKFQQ